MTLEQARQELNIEPMLIPAGASNRPGTRITPSYITIHETDNTSNGADARAHGHYLRGADARTRKVSFHFSVDDTRVVQHLPVTEIGWHAGDGTGNRSSIGIEICVNADGDQAAANRRAALLTAVLRVELGIPQERVVQHNHWSGKNCPKLLRQGNRWPTWLAQVQALHSGLGAPGPAPVDPDTPSPWAAEDWAWADAERLLDGTRPHDTVTREELAIVCRRLLRLAGAPIAATHITEPPQS